MEYRLLYPGYKKKAVTFSYDDGVIQDVKFIEILNRYSLKGTFNLNYGQSGEGKIRLDKDGMEIDCSHLCLDVNVSLYENHEIANHTYHHPHLETVEEDVQLEEYKSNKESLEKIFHKPVLGAAYPYGTYNMGSIKVQKELGIEYDRTTRSTYSFALPYDWLLWNPTIHHRDPRMMEILEKFFESEDELALLYIWGHAYEFAIDHNFELMDEIGKKLSAHDDIAYMTNHEIYQYVHAACMVYYRNGKFVNPSEEDVYLTIQGTKILVPAKGEVTYAG